MNDELPTRILLVEDNPGDARLVKMAFLEDQANEFRLTHVETQKAAIEQIDSADYKVLLLDLSLPDAVGIEGLKKIRHSYPRLPIIVFTGNVDDSYGQASIREGAQDYLVKSEVTATLLMRSVRYTLARQQAEELTAAENRKFRAIFENAAFGISIVDNRLAFLDVNPAIRTLLRKHDSELLQERLSDFLSPPDGELFHKISNEPPGSLPSKGEVTIRLKDSQNKLVEYSIVSNFVPGQHIVILRDIDERRRHEEILAKSEFRFRKLFESDIMGIFLTNLEGRVIEANATFLRITGYDLEDLKRGAISWAEMTVPGYEKADLQGVQQLKETGNCLAYEKEYFRKNGEKVPVLVGGVMLAPEKGELLAFAFDLSENRRLEKQFLELQKLEAVGLLAGGVAHDFNNVLGIILLNAESLATRTLNAEAMAEVETIKKATDRATALTRRLLTLSHKQVFNKTTLCPNSVIRDMEQIFRRLMGESVQVRLELALGDPKINMDQVQLEQILMNLFVNARDAMPNGGTLTVITSNMEIPAGFHHTSGATIRAGKYVRISVFDSGIGMTEEVQKRIFEPFFTTKPMGKGTGLGLATVLGITRQNDGYVDVESAPDRGAAFHIYLPASDSSVNFTPEVRQTPTSLSGEQKVILLVEDDADMRLPVAKLLKEKGFLVLEAENGIAACKVFNEFAGTISLIISDVIMPEMSGPAMLQEIRSSGRGRDQRVLFLSGYSSDELATHNISKESADFLEKPFNTSKLLNKLQEILGK